MEWGEMMQYTSRLNLKKPDLTDYVNVNDLNENFDIIDRTVGELQDGSTEIQNLETKSKQLAGVINEINQKMEEHLAEEIPHIFVDSETGKKYRWGLGVDENGIYLQSEEVIE